MENNEVQETTPGSEEQKVEEVVETSENQDNARIAELEKQLAEKDGQIADLSKIKRELNKEIKKTTTKEEKSEKTNKEEFGLTEMTYLATQGIEEQDEIDLAEKLQKETGKELVQLVKSKYFQSELKELRDANATAKATSGVKGGGSGDSKVNTNPEYWISKGVPPTREQVPNRSDRVAIHKAMAKNSATSGKKFYND